jgi:phosphoglycerate kinase
MKISSLKNSDLKGKTVLLRVDINSPVEKGRVQNSERIRQAASTIKLLKADKAKVVVLAHQGRPGKKDFLSLKQHSVLLNKLTKVMFVRDVCGEKALSEIRKLKKGEAILLENIRGVKDEFHDKKSILIKNLVSVSDIFVNDAFSVCHRRQASVSGFPKFLKSYAGPNLEKELRALEKIKIKNCVYVLGGSKPEENILLLKGNKVFACGIFGQMCLLSFGKKLGKNNDRENKKIVQDYEKTIKKLKRKSGKIQTPEDFAVKIRGKRSEIDLKDFPTEHIIYDIGEKTIKKYVREIKKSKAVFMKGPAGYAQNKLFIKGTKEILKAISQSRGFSVLGGGHLSSALKNTGISGKKFNHVSLSGGALIEYVAGKKLPGLEALK